MAGLKSVGDLAARGGRLYLFAAALALAFSGAAPIRAAEEPPEDTGWGIAAFEKEEPRYRARATFYQREAAKIRLRIDEVRRATEVFLTDQGRERAADLSNRYLLTDDATNRTRALSAASTAARDAQAKYETALAENSGVDVASAPEVRAKLWSLHLNMLRLRNAALLADLAYEDSRGVILRSLTTGVLGVDFNEWMNENAEDLIYAVTEGAADAVWNLAANCIGSWSATYLAWKRLGVPPDWGATSRDCAKSAVLDGLLVFWTTAWKKQFVDDLATENIPRPVAEYWWGDFLKPDEPDFKAKLKATFDDLRNEISKASVKEFVKELAVREIAGPLMEQIRKDWPGQVPPGAGEGFAWVEKKWGFSVRDAAARNMEKKWLEDLMRGPDDLERLYPNLLQRLEVMEQSWKWGSESTLLVLNYGDWLKIKPNQMDRYRRVRDCVAMSGGAVVAEEIVAKLKLPPREYAAFLKACGETPTPAEETALDRVRSILAEVSRRLAKLREEADDLAGKLAVAEQNFAAVVADAAHEIDTAAEAMGRLCNGIGDRQSASELERSRIESLRLAANRLADNACDESDPAKLAEKIGAIEKRAASAEELLAALKTRSTDVRSTLAAVRTPMDFAPYRTRLSERAGDPDLIRAMNERIDPEKKALKVLLDEAQGILAKQRSTIARGLVQQVADMTAQVDKVPVQKPSEIMRVNREAESAGKKLDELEQTRSRLGACPPPASDIDSHVSDLNGLANAAEPLVAATTGEKDRAEQCLADLRSGLADNASLVDSIRAAIDACEWDKARELLADLPESSQIQAAFGALYNQRNEEDARADTLMQRARALGDGGNPVGALGELGRAAAIAACRPTQDEIERLRTSLEQTVVTQGQAHIAACEFDAAASLATALRPGGVAGSKLSGEIAGARALDQSLVQEIAAVAAPATGRWGEGLSRLQVVVDKARCDPTRAAAEEAMTKVIADGVSRGETTAKGCDIPAMRALSAALGGHAAFAAVRRSVDDAYARESGGASGVERAASELAAGNFDAAAASAQAVLDADPAARCNGVTGRALGILEEIEKARLARKDADAVLSTCDLRAMKRQSATLDKAKSAALATVRAALAAAITREEGAQAALKKAAAAAKGGQLAEARAVLNEAVAPELCQSTLAAINAALSSLNDKEELADATDSCRTKHGQEAYATELNNGEFKCECQKPFILDRHATKRCKLKEQILAEGTEGCRRTHGEQAIATKQNEDGSFDCSCSKGYAMQDGQCAKELTPAEMAAANNAKCEADFGPQSVAGKMSKDGSFKCFCRNGYGWNAAGDGCISKQEIIAIADQGCQRSFGSDSVATNVTSAKDYKCNCRSGYTWGEGATADTCVRIKTKAEILAEGTALCRQDYGEQAIAIKKNRDGTFECSCAKGFVFDAAGTQCQRRKTKQETLAEGTEICINQFGPGFYAERQLPNGEFNCVCQAGLYFDASNKRCIQPTVEDGHQVCQQNYGANSYLIGVNNDGTYNCYIPPQQQAPGTQGQCPQGQWINPQTGRCTSLGELLDPAMKSLEGLGGVTRQR